MEEQIRELARQEAKKLIDQTLVTLTKKSKFVSLREAKIEYGLFGATLYRKVDRGQLSLVKMGGKAFLIRNEVENLFVKTR